jgi:hypothetical protein
MHQTILSMAHQGFQPVVDSLPGHQLGLSHLRDRCLSSQIEQRRNATHQTQVANSIGVLQSSEQHLDRLPRKANTDVHGEMSPVCWQSDYSTSWAHEQISRSESQAQAEGLS